MTSAMRQLKHFGYIFGIVCITQDIQCESKKSPLGFSENFSQTVGNF